MSDIDGLRLGDPRSAPSSDARTLDELESTRPEVAATRSRGGLWMTVGGAAALGVVVFLWLAARRDHSVEVGAVPSAASLAAQGTVSAAAPPPDLTYEEAAGRGGVVVATGPMGPPTFVAGAAPPPMVPPVIGAAQPPGGPTQALRAPTLVVDLAEGEPSATATTPAAPGTPAAIAAAAAAKPGAVGAGALNTDEQFANRVSAEQPERSQATLLHNRSSLIPQGATITGVLETALNSDLPGFTRAVVSRDVRGFDGSQILIPRGSRVIGQYKSAVAQGQTRAFVIWTRIIRPDGASIQIGSSGTDPLGRAGLTGKVDTHFFQRFSGAILLSVINAELTNLAARNNNTQIVIGSSTDATNASLAALVPSVIPPTIKVAQGAPIRIFVARDLDFSTVQSLGQ